LSDALVFMHGWGTSSRVWKKQVEYFAARYKIETPDYSLNPGPWTLDPILIGWSYGGMRAIKVASRGPINVKALVLISCGAKFTDGINPAIVKNLIRNLNRDFETTMRNCYGTFFSEEEAVFIDEFAKGQILPDKKETVEQLDALVKLDLKENLHDINIPTIIIHGSKDEVFPVSAGILLHRNIKDSKLEIIKNAGHIPFYTRPQEVNEILERFFIDAKQRKD
jgi:pimeloyl-ACP methyl ester carboxylesterase